MLSHDSSAGSSEQLDHDSQISRVSTAESMAWNWPLDEVPILRNYKKITFIIRKVGTEVLRCSKPSPLVAFFFANE